MSDASKTTGSLDRFGYLRWTPTSCRRCGYEQADCTCIGGFAAPMKEEPDMPQTTAEPVHVHPLNAFADRWELDGDCIRCRHCNRPQQVSWGLHDFPHAAGCRNDGVERNPWKSLAGLITSQIMRAKEPTA